MSPSSDLGSEGWISHHKSGFLRNKFNFLGSGPGTLAQVVKVLALHAQDPIWAPVLSQQPRFPSSSLPVARESSRGRPKALGACTRVGDPEEAPGFGSA